MAIRDVIRGGFGSNGAVKFVITDGLGIGAAQSATHWHGQTLGIRRLGRLIKFWSV